MKKLVKYIGLPAIALSALFTIHGNAFAQSLYGPNCPGYAARSPNSNTRLNVTFRNNSPVQQNIYWVNFNGGLKLYKTLYTGQSYNVNTYSGHIWLVWENNRCNLWFTATRNETWELN